MYLKIKNDTFTNKLKELFIAKIWVNWLVVIQYTQFSYNYSLSIIIEYDVFIVFIFF